jgi:lysophospholipid acyltransferase (LPLAT)-like uncharacterized protein
VAGGAHGSQDRAAHVLMAALGFALGLLARVWLWTLSVRVTFDATLEGKGPWIFGFLHGRQWPLLAWKRCRGTVVLVSWSGDGSLQACALAMQGLRVVRGSSSRGGARGLVRVVRKMREGRDAAFAVDGPRGPSGVVKGGVVTAARAAGGWLVPLGSAFERGFALDRSWDKFGVAWPFSRVEVVVGAPIDPASPRAREDLEEAIARANDRAERACARSRGRSRQEGKGGDGVDLDARPSR